MEALIPIIAILMVFGSPAYVVTKILDHRRERERMRLQAARGDGGGEEWRRERKLLVERIENLEAIVTSVDHDLNRKLVKLIDEQRLLEAPAAAALPAPSASRSPSPSPSPPPSPPPPPSPSPSPAPSPVGLDRTMTQVPRPRAANELLPGDVLAGRFRIERLLGRGGMGAVYLAHDEVLGELVALKLISSAWAADERALIERFKREASAARKVSSPHVIRIHDLGEARAGLLFLSMEYFPGKTLAEVIAARGLLPLADCADVLGQICAGLDAAHAAGVIHRDLKPHNVLVGERNAVKLIDFGLAKATAAEGLTASGMLMGTPHYMSPEQVRGKDVTAASDVYALGALAYHLYTGRPPFAGDNPIAIGFAHLSEAPTPPRHLRAELPPSVDAAILAALAKDPARRPRGPLAFRDLLVGRAGA